MSQVSWEADKVAMREAINELTTPAWHKFITNLPQQARGACRRLVRRLREQGRRLDSPNDFAHCLRSDFSVKGVSQVAAQTVWAGVIEHFRAKEEGRVSQKTKNAMDEAAKEACEPTLEDFIKEDTEALRAAYAPAPAKHPTTVHVSIDVKDLAIQVGQLRYDSLAKFLYTLTCQLLTDAHKDLLAGRIKLSNHLIAASDDIKAAWQLCESHMRAKQ